MKMKTILVLAFAVGCGLIAMAGVQQMLAERNGQGQNPDVSVLVATENISPGVLVSETNTEFRDLPAEAVPSDAVRNKEEYYDRGLLVPVMEGDIIRMTKLGGRGEIAASASIPKGMRTVSIQVNDTKTHSGLLQPGDRVDLQVTYEIRTPDGFKQTKSATLLEFIEVFASDAFRNSEAGESKEIKAKNITLLVTPAHANFIQLANTKGDLAPIMRSKTDTELINPEGVDTVVLQELKTGMQQDEAAVVEDKKPEKTENKTVSAVDSFKQFLDQGAVTATPIAEVETIEPEDNSWVITIFAGEDVISEDVGEGAKLENVSSTNNKSGKTAAIDEMISKATGTKRVSQGGLVEELEATGKLPGTMTTTLKGLLDSFLPGKSAQPAESSADASESDEDKQSDQYSDDENSEDEEDSDDGENSDDGADPSFPE